MASKKKFIVKLRLSKIDRKGCHISVTGKIKNKKVNLIIDTGASQTVFDKNRIAEYIGHNEFEKVDSVSSGLGTNTMESHLVAIPDLKIGELFLPHQKMMLLDLSHVNQTYTMMKMKPIDGVIGGDILKAYKAVIDYDKKTITFRI